MMVTEVKAAYLRPHEVDALPSKPADFRLAYGDHPTQFGDLRLPQTEGPYPVAIVIHGGCWLSRFADLQNTAALSDALRDHGIATWNIEYRCIDQEGGWPETFRDANQATEFLYEIADRYSLDINRVITIGHSAGGHLALWLAARECLPIGSQLSPNRLIKIRGVLALGAPPDLRSFRIWAQEMSGEDVVGALLGFQEERYAEISPQEMLPLGIPQILIYGVDDKAVLPAYGINYQKKANEMGDDIKCFVVEQAAHHEYNSPYSVTWPYVKLAVTELIKEEF